MRAGGAIFALLLSCAAAAPAAAQAPATRPVPAEDPYKDVALPVRRGGAATQASGGAATARASDVLDTKRLALALGIVLTTIFVTHRLWKRLGMPGAGGKGSGALQVVSRLSVSSKQQVLLIRVGRRLVLVGNCGTQMNPLCEISDPEETAGILGQAATQREGSVSSMFDTVLGGEEKRFDEQTNIDLPAIEAGGEAEVDPALATTREELSGLMDKVRSLSKQFRRA
jgi:flagellar biogenesis protein FliO